MAQARVPDGKWCLVLGFVLYITGRKQSPPPSFTLTHVHKFQNTQWFFTSNGEEVMALWAISLSVLLLKHTADVPKASSWSRNHTAEALIGTRHKDIRLLIRSTMKAALYTYQSLAQIMVYKTSKGHNDESGRVRHEDV